MADGAGVRLRPIYRCGIDRGRVLTVVSTLIVFIPLSDRINRRVLFGPRTSGKTLEAIEREYGWSEPVLTESPELAAIESAG